MTLTLLRGASGFRANPVCYQRNTFPLAGLVVHPKGRALFARGQRIGKLELAKYD